MHAREPLQGGCSGAETVVKEALGAVKNQGDAAATLGIPASALGDQVTDTRDVTDPSPWDEAAAGWDNNPATRAYAAAAFESLLEVLERGDRSLDGGRVLDFGCGTGLLIDHLVERVAAIDAVDTSPAMRSAMAAKIDRRGWTGVEVWPAPPLKEGGYDLIVCSSVLAFVDDLAATVADLAGRLAPGGLLISWDWEREADSDPSADDGDGLTRAEVREALESAGLVEVEVEIGFEADVEGHQMRPLRGVGTRPGGRA